MNKLMAFRDEQKKTLAENPDIDEGELLSVNMTMLSGGVQMNVVPNEIVVGFDIRIPPTVDQDELDKTLDDMVQEVARIND